MLKKLILIIVISFLTASINAQWFGSSAPSTGEPTNPYELFVPQTYSTIQAAITAANAGQTVVVQYGEWDEQLIGKNGVNLYFRVNASLKTKTKIPGGANYTFSDNNAPIKCKISGVGLCMSNTISTDPYPELTVIIWQRNSGSVIEIEGIDSIYTTATSTTDRYAIVCGGGTLKINNCNVIQISKGTGLLLSDGGILFVDCNEIKSSTELDGFSTVYCAPNSSGRAYINAKKITGTWMAVRLSTVAGSEVYINSDLITSTCQAIASYSTGGTAFINAGRIEKTGDWNNVTIVSYVAGGEMVIDAKKIYCSTPGSAGTNNYAIKNNAGIIKVYNAEISRIDTSGWVIGCYDVFGNSETYLTSCKVNNAKIHASSTTNTTYAIFTNCTFVPNAGAVGCIVLGTGTPGVLIKGCYSTIACDPLITPLLDGLTVDTDIK